jgi:hypothetical protein
MKTVLVDVYSMLIPQYIGILRWSDVYWTSVCPVGWVIHLTHCTGETWLIRYELILCFPIDNVKHDSIPLSCQCRLYTHNKLQQVQATLRAPFSTHKNVYVCDMHTYMPENVDTQKHVCMHVCGCSNSEPHASQPHAVRDEDDGWHTGAQLCFCQTDGPGCSWLRWRLHLDLAPHQLSLRLRSVPSWRLGHVDTQTQTHMYTHTLTHTQRSTKSQLPRRHMFHRLGTIIQTQSFSNYNSCNILGAMCTKYRNNVFV